ncbi:MAG: cbb3-type cytochrome c oxidase subunit I [Alphaproteobacteria bacterium]|nr:cbb3-type cytochrome c oxidase subunit I [Alphaproteobacteria bacterium]
MTPNTHSSLSDSLAALAPGDRRLIRSLFIAALAALALGLLLGLWVALARAGWARPDLPETGYRLLTLHGVAVFFDWLTLAQAGLLLVLAAQERKAPLSLAWMGWAGLVVMLVAFVLHLLGTVWGNPLLYDGSPELVAEASQGALLFYSGYGALALGLVLLALPGLATLVKARKAGSGSWSALGFGAFAWAGLLLVSAIALANTFLPAILWAAGWGGMPADHATLWHLLFHNMHYLPLLGTMLAWYLLLPELTGARSIFGSGFSKLVFCLYLVFVPPTSLYHMFLEPGLDPMVLVLGSLLSLFIGVPTIAAFLVVMTSLEAHGRARGARGGLGWLKALDWSQTATHSLAAAVINLALGGVLAFVLIQEKLAGLLSDTFFVPGYFHFMTLGVVTLSLLTVAERIAPALGGRGGSVAWARYLPWLITLGLFLFGVAGVVAGSQGMPRRVLDASYEGLAPTSWVLLSWIIGIGALLMALGLGLMVARIGAAYLGFGPKALAAEQPQAALEELALKQGAWGASLAVALLLTLITAATWGAFALMRSLPVIAIGGAGH